LLLTETNIYSNNSSVHKKNKAVTAAYLRFGWLWNNR